MKVYRILMASILLAILTAGAISAADNTTQDVVLASDSTDKLVGESLMADDLNNSAKENNMLNSPSPSDNRNYEKQSIDFKDDLSTNGNISDSYYLFRGDCWVVNNNFETSASITSESLKDLTVSGTFRTTNDLIGIYWNSKDLIEHPYITYGERSDYTDVILEFDYEMNGCRDFTLGTIEIRTNSGETYYLAVNRFIENSHALLNFNNLTLLPGNTYFDNEGKAVTVTDEMKIDVSDLKHVMFTLVPENYNAMNYTIMKNTDFTFKISNITVTNGEICKEQPELEAHQYRLCEGYDDIYNLNPYRLANEMRKLGYSNWVDLYIGASYYYEKSGIIGDVISEMNFNHNRTEKMVLDKSVPLNKAFRAWLDCYSRELKNNGVENLIISVSMENLQSPQSWRQMDCNGEFAMSGWEPSTFIYSPCNEEVVSYMQNVSEACLDIVTANGLKPVLQMGETWWWWSDKPYFYDNSTISKYMAEHSKANLPVYDSVYLEEYDKNAMDWLNQQLVDYSDALREVVKADKYDNGTYLALFFLPSVIGDNVPQMINDVNYIKDAYAPDKIDILQIEDYDWVIFESSLHENAYSIGEELGFSEDRLHYFGGFVQYREHADKQWPLIENAMEDAAERNFKEVYVWAGSQLRRDNKLIGYDEYAILKNLLLTNEAGIVTPIITAPDYAGTGENFTIKMQTNDWINGTFNVYEYKGGEKGNLLASNNITNGFSSLCLSSTNIGLNRFYLEFDYVDGGYHLIEEIYIIENSKNITADVSREVETGHEANVTFTTPKNSSGFIYISVDDSKPVYYFVENGEFNTTISNLTDGYHRVLIMYNDGVYADGKLVGEVYYKTFTVKVGVRSIIEAEDITLKYNSGEKLFLTLKDSKDNILAGRNVLININGTNHSLTTDENAQANLTIDLLPGEYSCKISYAGDDIYLSSFTIVNVTVNKIKTTLNAKDITTTYGVSKNLIITLKDENGNPLAGKNITINLNNKIYTRTIDSNGQAKLSISLSAKKYTAKISFGEDDIYISSAISAKIVVNKATTKISASSKTFKAKTKTKKVTATLKYNNKAIKNAVIKLTVNKKTYKVKTNSKGVATFKVKLTKKGKFNAVYKYAGTSNFKSATKKIKITIK